MFLISVFAPPDRKRDAEEAVKSALQTVRRGEVTSAHDLFYEIERTLKDRLGSDFAVFMTPVHSEGEVEFAKRFFNEFIRRLGKNLAPVEEAELIVPDLFRDPEPSGIDWKLLGIGIGVGVAAGVALATFVPRIVRRFRKKS